MSIDVSSISVIIPAYNAEKTLMRCLDSVLRQTFEDFEVIVIDDGSTDGTSALCNAYSNKDTRIKVIRQTNQGANVSRSIGLKRSQGKYVLQIDADDWLEPNMLERMHAEAIANDADMVICDFAEHLSDKVIEYKQCPPQSLSSDVILRGIINGSVKGVVWNKLIRRSLFAQYNVVFPSNIIWLEDVYVNAQLLLHPLKISYVSQPLYHYDRTANPQSITMDRHPKWNKTANGIVKHFRELLEPTAYWPLWVEKELPWIAYLCLYYHSFNADKYNSEFHYLIDFHVKDVNRLVALALKNYGCANFIIRARRLVSRMLHH